jgi:hypothetical protein
LGFPARASEAQHQVESGFLSDAVKCERRSVVQLLAPKDKPLLARWDACVFLDLDLRITDHAGVFHLDRERLPVQ